MGSRGLADDVLPVVGPPAIVAGELLLYHLTEGCFTLAAREFYRWGMDDCSFVEPLLSAPGPMFFAGLTFAVPYFCYKVFEDKLSKR